MKILTARSDCLIHLNYASFIELSIFGLLVSLLATTFIDMANIRLVRPSEVCNILGISIATLYREMKKPGFPSKIRISSKAIGFKESELNEWIESRIESMRGA